MEPDISIKCSNKKLSKGQNIKFQKESKWALQFKFILYFAIYIKSSQNNTDKTMIISIIFNGENETRIDTKQKILLVDNDSNPKKRMNNLRA